MVLHICIVSRCKGVRPLNVKSVLQLALAVYVSKFLALVDNYRQPCHVKGNICVAIQAVQIQDVPYIIHIVYQCINKTFKKIKL